MASLAMDDLSDVTPQDVVKMIMVGGGKVEDAGKAMADGARITANQAGKAMVDSVNNAGKAVADAADYALSGMGKVTPSDVGKAYTEPREKRLNRAGQVVDGLVRSAKVGLQDLGDVSLDDVGNLLGAKTKDVVTAIAGPTDEDSFPDALEAAVKSGMMEKATTGGIPLTKIEAETKAAKAAKAAKAQPEAQPEAQPAPEAQPEPAEADPQKAIELFKTVHGTEFNPKSSMDKRKLAEISEMLADKENAGLSPNQFALKLYRTKGYV